MPWGRIDDRLAMSVKIRGLADPGVAGERAKQQRGEALGVWVQVLSWVAGERSDGFVTEDIVRLFGTTAALDRLLRGQYGRAPLLHRRADAHDCECFEGRLWPDGWDYLIHDYLDRNPSRVENDVHRAKARELKDSALKTRVAIRDQNLCRYCGRVTSPADRRSDAGRQFDHVDPLIAAGEANLVTACKGCNTRKGRRTPEAAGMVLLDPGSTEPAVVVDADDVDETTADLRPAQVSDEVSELESCNKRITEALPAVPDEADGQVSGGGPVVRSGSGPTSDPDPDLDPDLDRTQIGRRSRSRSGDPPEPVPEPDPGGTPHQNPRPTGDPTQVGRSPGTGRDGTGVGPGPGVVGPPAPRAASRALSPYARPGPRNPDHHAGVPPGGGS